MAAVTLCSGYEGGPRWGRSRMIRFGSVPATIAVALLLVVSPNGRGLLGPSRSGASSHASAAGAPAADTRHTADTRGAATAAARAQAHKLVPILGRPGVLEARDPSYRAVFDAAGFTFLPARATSPLALSLTSVGRSGQNPALQRNDWTARGDVAQRRVAPGVLERVTVRSGKLEWDVVLATQPAGHGDLLVQGDLGGVVGEARRTTAAGAPALELQLRHGPVVELGETTVVDTRGRVLHRALPDVHHGRIELRVPAAGLSHARYPITVDPTVSGTIPVAPAGPNVSPSMAFEGANYLVVWEEFVAGDYDIYGSLIDANGNGAIPPFQISTRSDNEVNPDVAWNGSNFLVVWEDEFSQTDSDVRGQLLSQFGARVGGEISVSTPRDFQNAPTVAAGGSAFLVSWYDNRNGPFEIYAARVNSAGGVVDPAGIRLNGSATSTANQDVEPDVAWNGSQYLVVWADSFNNNGSSLYQIHARLVSPAGALGFFNAVALWDEVPHNPSVASNGTGFLVAWEQGSDIYGTRVDPTDVLLGPREDHPISTAPDTQTDPAVTYNGTYFVAWRDHRFPPDPDIYATRVANDGTAQDPNGIVIINTTNEEDTPAVAPAPGNNRWGIAYESSPQNTPSSTAINVRTAAK